MSLACLLLHRLLVPWPGDSDYWSEGKLLQGALFDDQRPSCLGTEPVDKLSQPAPVLHQQHPPPLLFIIGTAGSGSNGGGSNNNNNNNNDDSDGGEGDDDAGGESADRTSMRT